MITKNNKHDHCEVETQRTYTGKHYAQLTCTDCNKWIQWLSREEYTAITTTFADAAHQS